MLFDTHAHYDDERFNDDVYEILDSMPENNVGLIVNSCSEIADIPRILEFCEKYPFMYASIGVYPHNTENMTENDIDMLRKYSKHEKVVAIGEIGLDYYYDGAPKETQKYWLGRQVELARELNLPVVIHDRDAHGDILEVLKEHKAEECGGVFHCYSGSAEMAKEVLRLGMYIAFGGTLTFKNAVRAVETAKIVPDDRIVIETDSPYLAPVPMRGKRNSSLYIHYVAEKLAEIRNVDVKTMEEITFNNGKRLFRI